MSLQPSPKETIAAIATAISAGKGGIAVIRISGPEAIKVARNDTKPMILFLFPKYLALILLGTKYPIQAVHAG